MIKFYFSAGIALLVLSIINLSFSFLEGFSFILLAVSIIFFLSAAGEMVSNSSWEKRLSR